MKTGACEIRTFDTTSPQRTQKSATKLRLTRACTTMCAQRRVDSAVLAASASSLTRASYTAQFTSWTAQDLPDLDTPLNLLFRKLWVICAHSPITWVSVSRAYPSTLIPVNGAWPKGRWTTTITPQTWSKGSLTGRRALGDAEWNRT